MSDVEIDIAFTALYCYTLYNSGYWIYTMLAIRLDTPLIQQIDLLAKSKHSNRSSIIREAIIRFLEDNEDLELAMLALKKNKKTKSLAQLRKELELDSSD